MVSKGTSVLFYGRLHLPLSHIVRLSTVDSDHQILPPNTINTPRLALSIIYSPLISRFAPANTATVGTYFHYKPKSASCIYASDTGHYQNMLRSPSHFCMHRRSSLRCQVISHCIVTNPIKTSQINLSRN